MKICIISLGGTIAKVYSQSEASMINGEPCIQAIVDSLRLPDLDLVYVDLLRKDSLDITDDDRKQITAAVSEALTVNDAIILVHGTDTLAETGRHLHRHIPNPNVPVVLTGAMVPYSVKASDALQNITEALLAVRLIDAGVYCVAHNKVLRFPAVVKNHDNMTFQARA